MAVAACRWVSWRDSVGHRGKFGHEFMEFEFRADGKLRYANNSNYKKDSMIRKEGACSSLPSSVCLSFCLLRWRLSLTPCPADRGRSHRVSVRDRGAEADYPRERDHQVWRAGSRDSPPMDRRLTDRMCPGGQGGRQGVARARPRRPARAGGCPGRRPHFLHSASSCFHAAFLLASSLSP